ncbi:MAG: RNA polymerase sigma factor RpoD/SigA [Treponema sp.]|nr:RNA polymerase sigma factor RpoD/SigA [Treponema sp.]
MKKEAKTGNKTLKSGDMEKIYYEQIKTHRLLAFSEEIEFSRRIQAGDKNALQSLVTANLRIVIKIAKSYSDCNVPLMDMVQEGNLGLMHAAEKYDYRKNVRFCTYAGWWIRQYINRYLTNKRRLIRLPHNKEEILRKVKNAYRTLSQALTHNPSIEEIAAALGLSEKTVYSIINYSSIQSIYDMAPGKDDNFNTIDFHQDYTYNPERDLFQQYCRDGINCVLGRLQEREKQVIKYRYRLEDGRRYTLKEIGSKLHLSAESIRQIEMKAMKKIRMQTEELREIAV